MGWDRDVIKRLLVHENYSVPTFSLPTDHTIRRDAAIEVD